jgi:preprotein translocase subunit SecA
MFKKLTRIFSGDPHARKIIDLTVIVDQINALEPEFEVLSDEALAAKTFEFRARLAKGVTLDELLPEAFATVREASKRVLGQRHYDVQLICGINLHQGAISELRTGEGKTLSATLPLFLNALEGKGAHLITVNDYLARRDGRWMGAIYHKLGLSIGVLQSATSSGAPPQAYLYDPEERSLKEETNLLRPIHRKHAYQADITYGTNSEFGFDYLRDNINMSWDDRVQNGHHFAIIDEVDNILIDEARTPLIISGPANDDAENYNRMAQIVRALNPEDYELDEKDRGVSLTELGRQHVEDLLGQPLSDPDRPEDISPEQARVFGFLEQALRAQYLFHRNKEYIIQGGEVIIVDEFTGRMMPGRRWSDGLHQAMEAKEGVKVQAENITHATITIQNYFRMYKKLAGMTGTALTEQEEFFRIYHLDVLPIPTNLEYRSSRADSGLVEESDRDEEGYKYTFYSDPNDQEHKPLFYKRKDYTDVIYRTAEGKLRAIVLEITRLHVIGRPQLVGSTSVEASERLSERLSGEMVRRVIQVALIRQAWLKASGFKEEDYQAAPELAMLNEPLDKLRMPELRKLGSQFGLTSMDLTDPGNRTTVLGTLRLAETDWPRLEPIFDSGIPHQVLNARKHTEESLIIAGAGAFGAVTIATNMAGRGVDIKLGGELSENLLAQVNHVLASKGHLDPYNMNMQERLSAVQSLQAELTEEEQAAINAYFAYMDNMAKVRELGGLHVVGTERHEARRIDNQLRGRAARQGDPGSSRFYLALDDELMRMFGGSQMESLLSRFKIDENLPIELGLIAKVVEQSQTRVEGANFDVRKHLLEYDDVLNTQRNRIYTQRDRIFNKEDLHEDVTEMLHAELGSRVKAGLDDKEGPWKLLAWLEDVQPTLNTQWAEYPSFTYELALRALGEPSSEKELSEKLLKMAGEAVEAENQHILTVVHAMLDKGGDTLKTQLAERGDALDAYLDTLDDTEPHDVQAELTQILQAQIRLTGAQQRQLLDDPLAMKAQLKDVLKSSLTLNLIRHSLLTLERRFNETWSLKAPEMASLPWNDVSSQIVGQVEASLQRRSERMLGEEGEIARDLAANSEALAAGLTERDARLELLQLTTKGTIVGFDAKSHRRVLKSADRLTYLFSIAKQLDRKSPDTITADVLAHLEGAEANLVTIFGNAEWEHIQNSNLLLSALPEQTKQAIQAAFGQQGFAEVAETPLTDLSAETRAKAVPVLGDKAQNRIYRQLLLGTITESWVEYLTRMESLRVSISLESYAQRDPLIQYKSQASVMFTELLSEVRQTVITRMFRFLPSAASENSRALHGSGVAVPTFGTASPKPETARKKNRKRH